MDHRRRSCLRWVAIAALIACAESSAAAQDLLHYITGNPGEFRGSPTVIGDIDGDGTRDFAIASTLSYGAVAQSVRLFAGRGGALLREHSTGEWYDGFGYSVSRVGDVDGDLIQDYAISAPWPITDPPKGRVYVYSGLDGALLRTIDQRGIEAFFGAAVSALDDIDNDGHDDLLIGMSRGTNDNVSRIVAFSGSDGHELWLADGDGFSGFGFQIAPIADFDGDGFDDFVTSQPYGGDGKLELRSGTDGTVLLQVTRIGEDFAYAISVVSDLDGDGVQEIVAGTETADGNRGRAEVISGASGSTLHSIAGPSPGLGFGRRVASMGDLDFDGFEDFAATGGLRLHLYSGQSGAEILYLFGGTQVAGGTDFDGDGWSDVLYGNPEDDTDGKDAGRVDVVSVSTHPRVSSVDPARTNYRGGETLTVRGSYFLAGSVPSIEIAAGIATDVVVFDDETLTCTAPASSPGTADVRASNELGAGLLPAALQITPALLVEGDHRPGGDVLARWLIAPGDGILGIYGLAPLVDVPTPPFDEALRIEPFVTLFLFPLWFTEEFRFATSIPDDPALSGLEVAFQGLAGPHLFGNPKDGAWTNAVVMSIE